MGRSIANPEIFVQTNVMGTVNLLQRAKEAWYDAETKDLETGQEVPPGAHSRGLRRSGRGGFLHGD